MLIRLFNHPILPLPCSPYFAPPLPHSVCIGLVESSASGALGHGLGQGGERKKWRIALEKERGNQSKRRAKWIRFRKAALMPNDC